MRGSGAATTNDSISVQRTISFGGGDTVVQLHGQTGTPLSPVIVFGRATGSVRLVNSVFGTVSCSTLAEWSIQPRSGV
jgi:hypothetical protein